jgi:hypothetical protein
MFLYRLRWFIVLGEFIVAIEGYAFKGVGGHGKTSADEEQEDAIVVVQVITLYFRNEAKCGSLTLKVCRSSFIQISIEPAGVQKH